MRLIHYLIEHPEIRKRMSEKAYERSALFTDDIYFKNFVDILSQI